jgi:hypothetical protein
MTYALMTKTEKRILFADSIPDLEYDDDVYEVVENNYLSGGDLTVIILAIKSAQLLGVVGDVEAISILLRNKAK